MYKLFPKWLKTRDGATAIEYGLIAAGVCLVIAAAIALLGSTVYDLFYSDLAGALSG